MFELASLEWLRWSAAVAMVLIMIVGLWLMIRNPLGNHTTISMHIASSRTGYLLMALALTLGGALYYSFILFWLTPTYDISPFVYLVIPVAFVAQLCLAWIPANVASKPQLKWLHRIHVSSAWIASICMALTLVLITCAHNNLGPIGSIAVFATTAFSILCYILYFFVRETRKHLLFYESAFAAAFYIALLTLIFKI